MTHFETQSFIGFLGDKLERFLGTKETENFIGFLGIFLKDTNLGRRVWK
jgi:hypothetical protein